MSSILLVALGGACGALARYGAGRLVAHLVEQPFPWGTWTVNLLGCLLIGTAVPLIGALGGAERTRLLLVVGVLGSFTTFSTFSLDTVALWSNGHGLLGLLNAVGSVAGGLLFVGLGRWIAEQVVG
jgi:CrcB protein